jgi:hypothetical protein
MLKFSWYSLILTTVNEITFDFPEESVFFPPNPDSWGVEVIVKKYA